MPLDVRVIGRTSEIADVSCYNEVLKTSVFLSLCQCDSQFGISPLWFFPAAVFSKSTKIPILEC